MLGHLSGIPGQNPAATFQCDVTKKGSSRPWKFNAHDMSAAEEPIECGATHHAVNFNHVVMMVWREETFCVKTDISKLRST